MIASVEYQKLVDGAKDGRSRVLANRIARHGEKLEIGGSEDIGIAEQELARLEQIKAHRRAKYEADCARRSQLRAECVELSVERDLGGAQNGERIGEIMTELDLLDQEITIWSAVSVELDARIGQVRSQIAALQKRADIAEVERLKSELSQLAVKAYNAFASLVTIYAQMDEKLLRQVHLQALHNLDRSGSIGSLPKLIVGGAHASIELGRVQQTLETARRSLLGTN